MTTAPRTTTTISRNDETCPLARKHLPPHALMQTGYETREGGWTPLVSLAEREDGGYEVYDFRKPGEPEKRYSASQAMAAVRDFHALHADL